MTWRQAESTQQPGKLTQQIAAAGVLLSKLTSGWVRKRERISWKRGVGVDGNTITHKARCCFCMQQLQQGLLFQDQAVQSQQVQQLSHRLDQLHCLMRKKNTKGRKTFGHQFMSVVFHYFLDNKVYEQFGGFENITLELQYKCSNLIW